MRLSLKKMEVCKKKSCANHQSAKLVLLKEFISAEESGASFPTTKIRVKPNQTPISDDPTVLEKIKSSQKDIRDIYQEQSYDDLTNVLNEWLNPGDESSSEESTPTQATETSTSTMETKKVKDTSEAFDELFNS